MISIACLGAIVTWLGNPCMAAMVSRRGNPSMGAMAVREGNPHLGVNVRRQAWRLGQQRPCYYLLAVILEWLHHCHIDYCCAGGEGRFSTLSSPASAADASPMFFPNLYRLLYGKVNVSTVCSPYVICAIIATTRVAVVVVVPTLLCIPKPCKLASTLYLPNVFYKTMTMTQHISNVKLC